MLTVDYRSDPEPFARKEALYLRARTLEGRLLSDEQLRGLPDWPAGPLWMEWRMRRNSFSRLQGLLQLKLGSFPARVLDLGAGNGWMSGRLATRFPDWEIWALDLNRAELEQGRRVFTQENLRFVFADVFAGKLPEQYFDAVILAASVQYFPNFKALSSCLGQLLKPGAAAYITDSPFYADQSAALAAQKRSIAYYQGIGVPEMAEFYHQHCLSTALENGWRISDRGWRNWCLKKMGQLPPFPWLTWANVGEHGGT